MPRVLSTKSLSEAQKNLILQAGWSLVAYNAIQTHQLPHLDELKNKKLDNAIVTSQTTVSIIKELNLSFDNLFCVGNKTVSKLREAGLNVLEVANYGEDLARIISTNYSHLNFDFFCGKDRNEALPYLLKQQKIEYNEHHLYETISNPKEFKSSFDAILFFSPSGVESYYASNSFQGERIICIGKTTASAARKISNQVEIASQTSIESVIVCLVKTTL